MTREERLRIQMRAVQCLRAIKRGCTYQELSLLLGASPVVLNRYVKGHVLPGIERAERILEFCSRERLAEQVKQRLSFDEDGFVDNTALLFDTDLLAAVAELIAQRFPRANKVLTAAVDGIPPAVHIASALQVPCLFAKRSREIGVRSFVESRYKLASGQILNYFLPSQALGRRDRVLIVDDLLRSGETQAALMEIVNTQRATPVGVFSLIRIGDEGTRRLEQSVDCPVEALLTLDPIN